MRRGTKLLTCALVGNIFLLLYFSQRTVPVLEPVHVAQLNRKGSLESEAPNANITQNASVYDETVEKSATLTGIRIQRIEAVAQFKHQRTEGVQQNVIMDHRVEAVTQIKDHGGQVAQIKDHIETVTQRDQGLEIVTQTRDQDVETIKQFTVEATYQGVEAVTETRGQGVESQIKDQDVANAETRGQGVEEPVSQIKDQDGANATQIKESEQIDAEISRNLTVTSVNSLQPSNSSVAMQQTTQRPLSLLSSLHAPPSFPWLKREMKSNPERVIRFEWIKDLQSFLTRVDVRCPIAIVTSDSRYADALLNWLIASTVELEDPIKYTLILSLDSRLHQLLQNRSIVSLHILPSSLAVIKPNRFRALKQVEVVRFTVMRLLNFWGFDVANYDSDAMILKNPQPIYDRYSDQDVIGSAGYYPPVIHQKWGVTLCMGAVMIRATKQTELLWNAVHKVDIPDDQAKMNLALDSFHITWDKRNSNDCPWHGRGSSNLTVTILPMNWVCRGPTQCRKHSAAMGSYYIWHRGGSHSYDLMLRAAHGARVWFLRPNWKEVSNQNSLKGPEWLESISENTVQRT